MKKVLVIEDWEEFLKLRYPSEQRLLEKVAKAYELKDVVEFNEIVVKKPGYDPIIGVPLIFEDGDKLHVFVVKQKRKKSDEQKSR